ncbi:hypothetical protein BDN71DRAFT_1501437 [Pleurotus eryngii]|uniref:Uncharacterized protein n=1 Tax=Pleurotus eryngii TaxID=5323 RepID=A0A9P6A7T0_PLEER|nr:hypothetical protein BDN71DRAFT_1501437 [Pleurotus eryngii]
MRNFISAVLAVPLALATVPAELFSPLIAQKVLATAKAPPSPIQPEYPQYTDTTTGNWLPFKSDARTTGFFPATLDGPAPETVRTQARSGCSGSHLENPRNETARTGVNIFPTALAKRFNAKVGCTRNEDSPDPNFHVIIDYMVDLEVLFVAEKITVHLRTNFPRYLKTARRLATYFVSNISSDGIVPWDFNAPTIPAPRPADQSAATIAINALLLLSQRELTVGNSTGALFWRKSALSILRDVTNLAWRPEWGSLLSNGTMNLPATDRNHLWSVQTLVM